MSFRRHIVVSYDIVDDRRRNRVARLLKGYLQRVQKSVFEGELPPAREQRLLDRLGLLIDRDEDSIRVYPLCARCREGVRIIGQGRPVDPPDEDIVV